MLPLDLCRLVLWCRHHPLCTNTLTSWWGKPGLFHWDDNQLDQVACLLLLGLVKPDNDKSSRVCWARFVVQASGMVEICYLFVVSRTWQLTTNKTAVEEWDSPYTGTLVSLPWSVVFLYIMDQVMDHLCHAITLNEDFLSNIISF